MANLSADLQIRCEACGKPATQWALRDPFGKSDAKRPLCGEHGLRLRDPTDVAEIERLRAALKDLADCCGHDDDKALLAALRNAAKALSGDSHG